MVKPDLMAMILDEIEISPDIRNRLKIELNLTNDSDKLQRCLDAMKIAAQREQIMKKLIEANNQAEFKKQLNSMKSHLERVQEIIAEMGGANEEILNQSCWHINDEKNFISHPLKGASSPMDYWVIAMLRGIDFHLKRMSKPTKQKSEYVYSVAELADAFEKIFPDRTVSKEPESLFSKFVLLWLEGTQQVHMSDASRIIEKALSTRTE